jgi:cell division inhibitor SulA
VLESELLLESTERALRGEEMRLVLEWIAGSREVRDAVLHQSADLADVVGREVRGRSADADAAAERLARRILRRGPRGDGVS